MSSTGRSRCIFRTVRTDSTRGWRSSWKPISSAYRRVRIIGHAQTWWANISAECSAARDDAVSQGAGQTGGLLDRLLSEYPNLYADLSAGSGYGALTRDEDFTSRFLERHPRQLLFGSDCPCRDGRGENFRGLCYSSQLQDLLRRLVTDGQVLREIFQRQRSASPGRNDLIGALSGTS